MKIYLIRHGKTRQNELGILQGAGIDSELSETGRQQALLLKSRLPNDLGTRVFSSPLKRARETAQLATDHGDSVEYDANLIERDYGPMEGNTRQQNIELAAEKGVARPEDLEGIEPIESVNERVCAFLARLETVAAQDADCKSVVIVTHSGILGKFIRQVVSTKGGTLADELVNYDIGFIRCDNTSVTEIKLTMGKGNLPVYHIETIACARHLNC